MEILTKETSELKTEIENLKRSTKNTASRNEKVILESSIATRGGRVKPDSVLPRTSSPRDMSAISKTWSGKDAAKLTRK